MGHLVRHVKHPSRNVCKHDAPGVIARWLQDIHPGSIWYCDRCNATLELGHNLLGDLIWQVRG